MIQLQNLRQIKIRIKSIENTRKITRAMEMVSASKLNRSKGSFYSIRPYVGALEVMMRDLLSDSPEVKSSLLQKREHIKNTALCVVTSDTGLCGAYNNNMLRYAEKFITDLQSPAVSIIAVGKEAYTYFLKKGFRVDGSYLGLYGRCSSNISNTIAGDLTGIFTRHEADEVYIAYTRFNPSLQHVPTVEKLLNIEPDRQVKNHYIFERSAQAILDSLLPVYISCKIDAIIAEAFTSEHSARMLAMKTATDNAQDLIEQLTLARNKARQFAITKEVLEIAASAEALKG